MQYSKKETDSLTRAAIMFTIDALKDDIKNSYDANEGLKYAEAIRVLTEAYKNIK